MDSILIAHKLIVCVSPHYDSVQQCFLIQCGDDTKNCLYDSLHCERKWVIFKLINHSVGSRYQVYWLKYAFYFKVLIELV